MLESIADHAQVAVVRFYEFGGTEDPESGSPHVFSSQCMLLDNVEGSLRRPPSHKNALLWHQTTANARSNSATKMQEMLRGDLIGNDGRIVQKSEVDNSGEGIGKGHVLLQPMTKKDGSTIYVWYPSKFEMLRRIECAKMWHPNEDVDFHLIEPIPAIRLYSIYAVSGTHGQRDGYHIFVLREHLNAFFRMVLPALSSSNATCDSAFLMLHNNDEIDGDTLVREAKEGMLLEDALTQLWKSRPETAKEIDEFFTGTEGDDKADNERMRLGFEMLSEASDHRFGDVGLQIRMNPLSDLHPDGDDLFMRILEHFPEVFQRIRSMDPLSEEDEYSRAFCVQQF